MQSLRATQLYIDGDWCDGTETIEVRDLAAGGVLAHVDAAGSQQVEEALSVAEGAQTAMAATTPVERADWLEAIADELDSRAEELTDVIVRETGKPISVACGAPETAARRFRRSAAEARDLSQRYGEYREGSTPDHEGWAAIVKPEPIGTVLCISPYNYPLQTAVLQIAPALAAGNTVILTPSSRTPVTAAILTEIIQSAVDLPDGAFNFVPGESNAIGDTLAGDDRVDIIVRTGSSGAGHHVSRKSKIANLVMELGGNAPALVFPNANLSAAADACAAGSFKFGGQRCSAVSRVLAHESIHDEIVERIELTMNSWVVGDPFEESTDVGPLIDADHAKDVDELVQEAVEAGAELIRGGERDGAFYEPTLLANIPQNARIIYEEQSGPVAAVASFANEDEAIELANASDLALNASVFTTDHNRALRLADQLNAGGVRINGVPSHGIDNIPFGGTDASGINRDGIHATIEQLIQKKSIVL